MHQKQLTIFTNFTEAEVALHEYPSAFTRGERGYALLIHSDDPVVELATMPEFDDERTTAFGLKHLHFETALVLDPGRYVEGDTIGMITSAGDGIYEIYVEGPDLDAVLLVDEALHAGELFPDTPFEVLLSNRISGFIAALAAAGPEAVGHAMTELEARGHNGAIVLSQMPGLSKGPVLLLRVGTSHAMALLWRTDLRLTRDDVDAPEAGKFTLPSEYDEAVILEQSAMLAMNSGQMTEAATLYRDAAEMAAAGLGTLPPDDPRGVAKLANLAVSCLAHAGCPAESSALAASVLLRPGLDDTFRATMSAYVCAEVATENV